MYEYKVVPAPAKGVKAKGVKTGEARFALAIEQSINDLAAEGWEYQRTDVLPSEERQGLTGSATHWRNLMVFRREILDVDLAEPVMTAPRRRMEPVLSAATPIVSPAVPEGDGVAEEPESRFEEDEEETRPA